jgi:hypothetical protein
MSGAFWPSRVWRSSSAFGVAWTFSNPVPFHGGWKIFSKMTPRVEAGCMPDETLENDRIEMEGSCTCKTGS